MIVLSEWIYYTKDPVTVATDTIVTEFLALFTHDVRINGSVEGSVMNGKERS